MITVALSVIQMFRLLCRRGGLHKGRPTIEFVGSADGLRVQCATPDVAVEYFRPGPHETETIRVPFDALDPCKGLNYMLLTIQSRSPARASMSWSDRGIPQQHDCEQPKTSKSPFPDLPTSFMPNDPRLWRPLADAVAVTDPQPSRYALNCLCLRRNGRVVATDGKHALVQDGYRLDGFDDVLVPASKILGCSDLDNGEPFGVGRTQKWVAIERGSWRLLLRIQEGQFPKIDDVFPAVETAKSRLELSEADADFLAETLPRLPGNDDQFRPITVDLNGHAIVRACGQDAKCPTEVCLTSSRLVGDPIVLQTNRVFVEHALKLRFRAVHFFGPERPALCVAPGRRYLWMLLGGEGAVKPAADAVRIDSPAYDNPTHPKRKEEPVTVPINNQVSPSATPVMPDDGAKRQRPRPTASTIDQALALRDSLRTVAQQAGELARSLKQQRRQTRIVETTLASLKQLQKVAG
jgi:hypothetical protein